MLSGSRFFHRHIVLGSTRSDSSEVAYAIESPLEGRPEKSFEVNCEVRSQNEAKGLWKHLNDDKELVSRPARKSDSKMVTRPVFSPTGPQENDWIDYPMEKGKGLIGYVHGCEILQGVFLFAQFTLFFL